MSPPKKFVWKIGRRKDLIIEVDPACPKRRRKVVRVLKDIFKDK